MNYFLNKQALLLVVVTLIFVSIILLSSKNKANEKTSLDNHEILSNTVNSTKQKVKLFWKNDKNKNYGSFQNLKRKIEAAGQELVFATNGGMYDKNHKPKGLYIENGVVLSPIDRKEEGYGNFYLNPNGIFYIKNTGKSFIKTTKNVNNYKNIKYATQSGPMLVIDVNIHPKFTKGSKHTNIRNGVGILANGNILFAMSKEKINFFDFASYFKAKGCKNALYLDGFVSKTYLPSKKWKEMDGDFGVIIGIIE